jgi:histidine triad (HIT) family protein
MNERIEPGDCIFCKIVRGEAPAHVVCEDERTLTFMDIFPVAAGHVLVIPKAHCTNLLDADATDLEAVIVRARSAARAIRDALGPDGIGTFQLNGAAAGQTVFHYHLHLIPRQSGEKLEIHGRKPGKPARLAELAARLADAVAAQDGDDD